MTTRTEVPIGRIVWTLIRNQPVRYGFSLTIWVIIWTMPILAGFIAAAFFNSLTDETAGWNIWTLVAAMWAYVAARILMVFSGMRLHSELLFRMGAGLRSVMLAWIFSLPGAQSIEETPGEVVSRFRDDVEHTLEAADFTVDLAGSIVSAVVSLIVLFAIDPVITIVVFTPLVVIIFIVSRTGSTVRRYRTAARDSTEAITGFLGETFSSVQSVKVAGAESTMIEHFNELNEERRKMMVRDRTFTSALEAVFRNTVSIGTGLILMLAAGSLARGGSAGLTIGEFSLFVFLLAGVTESTYFIGMYIARLKQASVSAERMLLMMRGAEWEDLVAPHNFDEPIPRPAAPAPAVSDVTRPNGAPLLSTNGLSFHYQTSGQGIDHVDLNVPRGEFVVVTGRIGSGKTTLLRTVLGLLPADSGSISWNGAIVEDPALFMTPPRTAYTPQVPRLFSLTLRENLLLGHPVSDEELEQAIHTATMEDDLAGMPDGLGTMVGPRGVRLSGGQVQRSAAARMLAREPELFVFDDVSSALDVETEQMLWDRLFSDTDQATALVVSHRRPALQRADRVVVMRDGRIEATGTADELLESNQEFRRLWSGDFATE
jgi:ATP-binding cassette subfamily B protein